MDDGAHTGQLNEAAVRAIPDRARWLPVLWAVLLALSFPAVARAENLGPGGGSRVITGDQVVGPYRLLITASPEPAQVGQVTFIVRVSDAATADKVREAQVTIALAHSAAGTQLRSSMTHEDAGNAVDYAAHITLEQPGLWDGVITVTGAAGKAEVSFIQRILPARQLSTALIVGMPFLVILGALALFWYARSGSRRPERP